jgi:hypothetical protein
MDLEIGFGAVGWIGVAQDSNNCRARVNAAKSIERLQS